MNYNESNVSKFGDTVITFYSKNQNLKPILPLNKQRTTKLI